MSVPERANDKGGFLVQPTQASVGQSLTLQSSNRTYFWLSLSSVMLLTYRCSPWASLCVLVLALASFVHPRLLVPDPNTDLVHEFIIVREYLDASSELEEALTGTISSFETSSISPSISLLNAAPSSFFDDIQPNIKLNQERGSIAVIVGATLGPFCPPNSDLIPRPR